MPADMIVYIYILVILLAYICPAQGERRRAFLLLRWHHKSLTMMMPPGKDDSTVSLDHLETLSALAS
jgi:hypothetical protein